MKGTLNWIYNVALYVVIFLLIQFVVTKIAAAANMLLSGADMMTVVRHLNMNVALTNATYAIIISVVSSALTIALFTWRRWTPLTRGFIKSRPWAVLFWVVLLAIGTIIPSEWLLEEFNLEMSDSMNQMLGGIMSKPLGYIAIGILVPLAEEIVFRGAILRLILKAIPNSRHWIAIIISALLFALVHGNMAQFVHAFIIGLLLGWMYYRTGSIIPGVLLHWVNNTIAYAEYNIMPWAVNSKLIDLCHGDQKRVYMYVAFSVCILVPSLFQLSKRLRREQNA